MARKQAENGKQKIEDGAKDEKLADVGGHLLAGNVWVRVDGGAAWPGLNKGFVSKPT